MDQTKTELPAASSRPEPHSGNGGYRSDPDTDYGLRHYGLLKKLAVDPL